MQEILRGHWLVFCQIFHKFCFLVCVKGGMQKSNGLNDTQLTIYFAHTVRHVSPTTRQQLTLSNCSAGLVSFSFPMVEYRSPDMPLPQGEPLPWAGNT